METAFVPQTCLRHRLWWISVPTSAPATLSCGCVRGTSRGRGAEEWEHARGGEWVQSGGVVKGGAFVEGLRTLGEEGHAEEHPPNIACHVAVYLEFSKEFSFFPPFDDSLSFPFILFYFLKINHNFFKLINYY